ncbi:hypothetical protein E4O03_10415 [Treponema sp. OMZ 792]|uniref:hypothetical protein n=1 Tax=unclassified Treponema TaxID=2638727 RepID=UPI0020A490CD|nr:MULTISPECIES: hypothetical protein [unclassified Treponema]UTC74612.1 hypothetical protein E4O03_10415 [Treponema sp. OMZ 792]UTC77111.1 hypothetical protein E4O04_03450 [Treponema sp. OMZ 799]UTC81009.1 hypothetical protein E4O07_10325 [Treponema sp. OMZ 798]
MAKFRIPIICAIAALALSFLLGLISGVRFSTILLRSLIISLISGGFVLGAQILLDHFVPDLFQSLDSQESEKKETGKNLNISIDEPVEVPFMDDEERADLDSGMVNAEPVDENSILDDTNEPSDEDLIDEDFASIKDDSQASASKNVFSDGTEKKQEKNTVKELEELPDLQDFIPEDEPEEGDDQMDFTQRGTAAFDVSTDLAGSGMDTNTMVNAIRTVLKRDS